MPRIANETSALVADITKRLERLAAVARDEGRAEALEEVRALVGGGKAVGRPRKAAAAAKAKPAKKAAKKSGKPRKNPWATMTPEQKKARVRKMLAGRGLKPKSERGPAKKTARKTGRKKA